METLQIAFYKGTNRVFNRAVCFYLRGKYSHTELILGYENGYALCASSSFMDGGVRVKHIKLDPEHWDLVEVQGSRAKALEWVQAHEDCGYSVWGLLGFIWRPVKDESKNYFCTQAVMLMLGLRDAWRFDPCSYAATLGLQP